MAAIEELGNLPDSDLAQNTLVGLMHDPDADIRRAVVIAFGKFGGSYVETQLQYCLSHEKDVLVLDEARKALTQIRETKKRQG